MSRSNSSDRGLPGSRPRKLLSTFPVLLGLVFGNAIGSERAEAEDRVLLPLFHFVSPRADLASFGTSVARLGDVDGDGFEDFALGGSRPIAAQPFVPVAVFVHSGRTGALLYEVRGIHPLDDFGSEITSVGDVNGDGAPDFAIGASGTEHDGLEFAGRVAFVSGADGVLLWERFGERDSTFLGANLAAIGDVDGDEIPDVLASVSDFAQLDIRGVGAALLLSGTDGSILRRFEGLVEKICCDPSHSLAGPGDLDGDGTPDLLLGYPNAQVGERPHAGIVLALSGADGSELYRILGEESDGGLGFMLAALDDMDGDGVGEFAGSEPGAGSGIDRVFFFSGASGEKLAGTKGPLFVESQGAFLAADGDFDGDGSNDLVAGGFSGNTFVVFSLSDRVVTHEFTRDASGVPFPGPIAFLRDLDGDGRDELLNGTIREATVLALKEPIHVAIDVMPRDCTNAWDPRGRSPLRVVVFGSEEVALPEIDASRVFLGAVGAEHGVPASRDLGAPGELAGCACPSRNRDGFGDREYRFDAARLETMLRPRFPRFDTITLLAPFGRDHALVGTDCLVLPELELLGRSSGNDDEGPADAFGVEHASPNPARPGDGSVIAYRVPRGGAVVSVGVYAVNGRQVATLARGWHPGGDHEVAWNGRDAAGRAIQPGVYFVRARVGERTSTARVVYVR